jgi:hypothetical protein
MKLEVEQKLESATVERLVIRLEWNPQDTKAETYAALIASMTRIIKEQIFLERVLNDPA